MTRRRFLNITASLIASATLNVLTGCNNVIKPNIRKLGKTAEYLVDPELRRKETGDALLIVRNAEISGVTFHAIDWRNIRFVDCDFVGAYELKLASTTDCAMEGCRFEGIHMFGTMRNVRFYRCQAGGGTFVSSRRDSTDVIFEECAFIGSTREINHWGDVGSYGEATFIKCKAKWFAISGDTKLTISECDFEDIESRSDSSEIGGVYSTVVIQKSKLRGLTKMVAADLQSLTIRDTLIDGRLDLTNATIKGDVLMERVRANVIKAGVRGVRNFTIRDSQILGPGNPVFDMAIGGPEQVLLDKVNFGSGVSNSVGLGAGRPLEPSEWRALPTNKLAIIRNCTLPDVDASWLETQKLRLENNTIGQLNLSNSRIGALEIAGNTISRTVDFTGTQVKESKVQSLAKGQAKLDGSNIELPR